MKRGDLVYIRWEDSCGCPSGWEIASEARNTTVTIIESVGWVSAKDKRAVQIAPHVGTYDGELSCLQGHMTIPLSGLLKVTVIEKAKKRT